MYKIVYVDAGCSNNGNENAELRIAITDKEGKVLLDKPITSGTIEDMPVTNNSGEFEAIIAAIKLTSRNGIIYSDSQLAVNMLTSWYGGKGMKKWKPHLREYVEIAREKLIKKKIKVYWIPREENLAGQFIEYMYDL